MQLLRNLYASIRSNLSTSRVVAFLVIPVLTPLAGWFASQAAEWGFNLTPDQTLAAFVIGAGAVIAAGFKWLDGLAHWENTQANIRAYPANSGMDLPDDIDPSDLPDDADLAKSDPSKA